VSLRIWTVQHPDILAWYVVYSEEETRGADDEYRDPRFSTRGSYPEANSNDGRDQPGGSFAPPSRYAGREDRWLLENKAAINAKIRRGIDQLNRGEGIPEDKLDAYLAKLKAPSE
jgi:hypothetical protein